MDIYVDSHLITLKPTFDQSPKSTRDRTVHNKVYMGDVHKIISFSLGIEHRVRSQESEFRIQHETDKIEGWFDSAIALTKSRFWPHYSTFSVWILQDSSVSRKYSISWVVRQLKGGCKLKYLFHPSLAPHIPGISIVEFGKTFFENTSSYRSKACKSWVRGGNKLSTNFSILTILIVGL